MPKNRFCLLLIMTFFLTGCSGLQKDPPVKRYYDLKISPQFSPKDIQEANTTDIGKSLLVKELRIAPPYDSHAFVYKVDTQSYRTDFYNEFITYPTRLISEKIAEHLFSSIYFSQPVSARKQAIDYRVSGKITRLYGDFQIMESTRAVIEIRLVLENRKKNRFTPVFSHIYRYEDPLDLARPEHLTAGWSKGLEKIILNFIADYKDTR